MVDIIVPVYNEAESVPALFEEIKNKVRADKRVLVVYDFDEDNTVPVVQSLQDKYPFPILLVKNTIGRGALNAIKMGFQESTAGVVIVTMADLADDLSSMDEMLKLFDQGYDLVCGSRYMKGGKQIGGPLLKKTLSRLAGVTLHYLIRIPTHDVTNSFKMYSRRVLDAFPIESGGGFELGMELTVKAYTHGMKVGEVPTSWTDRAAGQSNFKMWEWMPRYIHWYLYGIQNTWFRRREAKA